MSDVTQTLSNMEKDESTDGLATECETKLESTNQDLEEGNDATPPGDGDPQTTGVHVTCDPVVAQHSYELEGSVIYWPQQTEKEEHLTELIDLAMDDCWRTRPQGVTKSAHRLKIVHLGLWSIAEMFPKLNAVMREEAGDPPGFPPIKVSSNEDIKATLGISATVDPPNRKVAKEEEGDRQVERLYCALTALCLVVKQPVCHGKFIGQWSHRRLSALVSSLELFDCEVERLSMAPRDSAILHHFFRRHTHLTLGVVTSVLSERLQENSNFFATFSERLDRAWGQCNLNEVTFFAWFERHLDYVWRWSGLSATRIMYDFCRFNFSKVWELPGISEDVQRFQTNLRHYLQEYEKLAPYGRLLHLPLARTLDNQHFPHLYFAACVEAKQNKLEKFKHFRVSEVATGNTTADIQEALSVKDYRKLGVNEGDDAKTHLNAMYEWEHKNTFPYMEGLIKK